MLVGSVIVVGVGLLALLDGPPGELVALAQSQGLSAPVPSVQDELAHCRGELYATQIALTAATRASGDWANELRTAQQQLATITQRAEKAEQELGTLKQLDKQDSK